MAIPNKPSYSHGSTGTEPGTAKDYDNGDPVESDHFDHFVYTPFNKIKAIIDSLNNIVDGSTQVGDSDTVDGQHASDFLGANEQATDADTVDGKHASEVSADIENGGTTVVSNSDAINAGTNMTAVDDGDGTATLEASGDADTVNGYNVLADPTYKTWSLTSESSGTYDTITFSTEPVVFTGWAKETEGSTASVGFDVNYADGTTQSLSTTAATGQEWSGREFEKVGTHIDSIDVVYDAGSEVNPTFDWEIHYGRLV